MTQQKSDKPAKTTKGPQLEAHQIVMRPLISEKGTHQVEHRNAYSFIVNPLATKDQIKKAVEELFNVQVVAVRTQNRKGKPRRFKAKQVKSASWKKAIVTLSDNDRIALF